MKFHIKADLSGRPKHIYSIYRKMALQNKQFSEIYDLLAVRIVVNSIKDCYAVLGIIHTAGSQCLVDLKTISQCQSRICINPCIRPLSVQKAIRLEVQIRTLKCIGLQNSGLQHTGLIKKVKTLNEALHLKQKLTWFREILEFQNDTANAEEFMESLKIRFIF